MVLGRPWSVSDLKRLKQLYPNTTNAKIARILTRTERAIQHKALDLNLLKTSQFFRAQAIKSVAKQGYRLWSKQDLKQLRELYPIFPTREVAKRHGRTKKAVIHRAKILKIKKRSRPGMFGNNYKYLGETKEDKAIAILKSKGWELLMRGGYQTAYDAIMKRDGDVFAINIKFGKKFTESKKNLQRLFSSKHKPAIFYFTKEDRCYFMEVEALS